MKLINIIELIIVEWRVNIVRLDSKFVTQLTRIDFMCGFVGLWRREGAISSDMLAQQVARLHHRGPDDHGIWVEDGVGLAHARLSIHDLSPAGHQPMFSSSGRWVIVYNGEIYNYREVRAEINNHERIEFKSDCDTEVLINAIELWGLEKALNKMVGMFAFACWDRHEHRLYLARDRFGEKPLYYGFLKNDFIFTSELKAIEHDYREHLQIDRDALASYMRYGYVPVPYSIYKNIYKLEPGNILEVNRDFSLKKITYWSATEVALRGYLNPTDLSFSESVLHLENALKQTLSNQMLADVELGAFLSGGIDSTTIVALMQSISSQQVKTFSIGFHEKKYNEAPFAKAVANHLKTDHTELYVTSRQALDVVERLPEIYDEPFADSSQIPTFLVSHLTKQKVTVSLSGDAGDELFGGYNRYFFAEKVRKYLLQKYLIREFIKLIPDRLISLTDFIPQKRIAFLSHKIKKAKNILTTANKSFLGLYRAICSQYLFPNELVINANEYNTFNELGYDALLNTFDPISWMMLVDACTYLLNDILVKVDRAAMAVSLETRIPFLDHRIYEFAWQLPLNYKIEKGKGKQILRAILAKYVPQEFIDRPKRGFGIPVDEWLRGDLKQWAEQLLEPTKIHQQGYLDAKQVTKLWTQHLSGKYNRQSELWSILMFQAWLEKNKHF